MDDDDKVKKERSPSYPFISLEKAVTRVAAMLENHKREPARVASVGGTWGYAPRSSGLLQTIAALKQYGLVEDVGSGEDRKIQITELARRILMDQRAGARETGLKEAARNPRLFSEYIQRWVPDRPNDSHIISELQLDRGFNAIGAANFLKVFDATVAYAGLGEGDSLNSNLPEATVIQTPDAGPEKRSSGLSFLKNLPKSTPLESLPFNQRLKVELTATSLAVTATLLNPSEVDKLIRILEANKLMLSDADIDGTV
ncbi:MAG TPA: hypothetical protein VGG36_01910 [Rhizomicrobium sp.]